MRRVLDSVWRVVGCLTVAAVLVLRAGAAEEAVPGKKLNHLAGSTSPYLLQHADNPVDWYPWGPEALAKAKREGKPIFLSIGYAACHWCHVMERESFRDDGIAQQLNERFVCIKVDREERPDIDDLYMTGLLLLQGRGGWPTSMFLTPEGKPFHGGTYFKRDDFAELLRSVHAAWSDPGKRKQVEEQADRLTRAIGETATTRARSGSLTPQLVQGAVKQIREGLDEKYGGFGGAPKFPPVMRLTVLLEEHRRKPDPALLKAVTLTLDRMARGGIYDQFGGGFHRYSVDEKWQVPHFEKMLYDNALLAWIYLEAQAETGNKEYLRIARETIDFVQRELQDPAGGFRSSLDAESAARDGTREEGEYYLWTPEQVAQVLRDPDQAALYCKVYGISAAGQVRGKSVPNLVGLDETARELKRPASTLLLQTAGWQPLLEQARVRRPRPRVDSKLLASWNGLMLRTLAVAYDRLGEIKYRQAAEKTAQFLLETVRKDGRMRHSYREGVAQPQAFLEDYSYVAAGLLALHQATGEERWLKEADALAQAMVDNFWNEERGTFDTTPRGHEALIARRANVEEDALPSAQSVAAQVLLTLGRRTGNAGYREKARRTLEAAATEMKRSPHVVAGMVAAAQASFLPEAVVAPERAGRAVVTAAVEGLPAAVRPNQELELTVRLQIEPGWHINSDRPTIAGRIPTRVELASGPFKLLGVTYPEPEMLRPDQKTDPIPVFAKSAVVRVRLKALPSASVSPPRLKVRYQACNDQVCDAPRDLLLTASR